MSKGRMILYGNKSAKTDEDLMNNKKNVMIELKKKETNKFKYSSVNDNNESNKQRERKELSPKGGSNQFLQRKRLSDSPYPMGFKIIHSNGKEYLDTSGINSQLLEDDEEEEQNETVHKRRSDKKERRRRERRDEEIFVQLKDTSREESSSKRKEKEREREKEKEKKDKAMTDLFAKGFIKIPTVELIAKHPSKKKSVSKGRATLLNKTFPWVGERSQANRGMLKLHYEILEFYEYIKPNEAEDEMRKRSFTILKDIIGEGWPEWKIKKFGSFPNKLHLADSDLDIVVIPEEGSTIDPLRMLKRISDKMIKANAVDYIRLIEARVPIIRATLKETKINVDISANRKNGYEAKKVIKEVLLDFPYMRPLIYLLKYFLKQRKLNETFTGGISSFLLFNLLFAYIQYLRKQEEVGELSLGHLLVGFLQFYAFDFNYEQVGISIRFGGYFYKKEERLWQDSRRGWLLSVENFQDLDQDVGKSAFKFKKVLDSFKQARDALYYPSKYPIDSYIGHFIHMDAFLSERHKTLRIKS